MKNERRQQNIAVSGKQSFRTFNLPCITNSKLCLKSSFDNHTVTGSNNVGILFLKVTEKTQLRFNKNGNNAEKINVL